MPTEFDEFRVVTPPRAARDDVECPRARDGPQDFFSAAQHGPKARPGGDPPKKSGESLSWLVVSIRLKHISEIGSFPPVGVKINNL